MKKNLITMMAVIVLSSLCVFSCQDINVNADVLKAPIFTTESGTRFEPQLAVQIENPNGNVSGHVIRYTQSANLSTPPDDPTENSPEWTGAPIDATMIIKARAFNPSYTESPVATATFYRVWTTKAPMLTARRGAAVVALNGKIYVIGGRSGTLSVTYYSTVEEYTPGSGGAIGSWATKANMKTTRAYATASVLNGKIFVFGGHNETACHSSVEEFTNDSGLGIWIDKNPMPVTARAHASAITCNGKIYLTGGENTGGLLSRVDAFSPVDGVGQGVWEPGIATLLSNRKDHASIVYQDMIYILGGEDSSVLSTVEKINPINNLVSLGVSMLTKRCQFACVSNSEGIYVFGGYLDSIPTYLNKVEKYTVPLGWVEDDYVLPQGQAEMGSCMTNTPNGNSIFLIGGRTLLSDQANTVEEYSPY